MWELGLAGRVFTIHGLQQVERLESPCGRWPPSNRHRQPSAPNPSFVFIVGRLHTGLFKDDFITQFRFP